MEESNASIIVDSITKEWLGTIGGLLAVLGVIAAPITSGDTALRSARLIVADFMHLEQKSIAKRLLICIPIFAVTIGILLYSQRDAAGFDMIWRYFAWCNQALSVFYFVGGHCFSSTCEKELLYHLVSCPVYDGCMFYLYLHSPRRISVFGLCILYNW